MFRHFKYDMKLINKFKLSFIFVAFIPLVLLSIAATYNSGIYIEKAEKQNQFNQLKMINSIIDFNYEMYIHKAEQIFSNEELQRIINKQYEGIVGIVEGYDYIDKYFKSITFDVNYTMYRYTNLKSQYNDIKIKIYTYNETLKPDARYIFNLYSYEEEDWMQKALESDSVVWDIYTNGNGEETIRFGRKLVNFKNLEVLGVLNIDIPMSMIRYMIDKNRANEEEYFFYLDDKGKVIIDTSSNTEMTEMVQKYYKHHYRDMVTQKVGNSNYILYGIDSEITDWHLVSFLPLKYIKEGSRQIRISTLLVAFLVLVMCLIMAQILSNMISKRLRRLVKKIKRVEKDHYSEIIVIEGDDEIGQVDQVFNSMIEEMKKLIEVEYTSKILRDSLKLDLLQEQINPHLLYNTLSAIGWHAKKGGNIDLFNITNSLIRFYRTSLNRGQVIIPFKQEIEMTLEYISLIEFTYNMDIQKDFIIPHKLQRYFTIKLILQPIVENALMHGLRNSPKKGKLKLHCFEKDDLLIIEIEDNGMGMDEETVQILLDESSSHEKGYGLTNVIKRLRLYYGDYQYVNIVSSKEEGTKVTVSLPAMEEDAIKEYLDNKALL